jgi:hypothetical protein
MFFYGSLTSLAMLGIYTDFLAQRNLYTLLTFVITIQILFTLTQTIYSAIRDADVLIKEDIEAFIAGYFNTLSTIL